MKKRTAFIGAILSLMPLGQPLIIKSGVVLSSAAIMLSLPEKVNADNADFYFERGITKAESGNYEGAITDFSKAIRINPQDADAYYLRGLAKAYLGLEKKAIVDFSKAIEINSDDSNFFFERGVSKLNLNFYEEAIVDFTNVIKMNSQYADAYSSRGLAKSYLGLYKESIIDFSKAIKLKPNDADSYFNRALSKEYLEDYEGFVIDNNMALKIDAQNKVNLSVNDIINQDFLQTSPQKKVFNSILGFDGQTYKKPLKYYIHDEDGKIKTKSLPSYINYAFEISNHAEDFIVDVFSKIDTFIDLDFKRVYSPKDAHIIIYNTKNLKGGDKGITAWRWKVQPSKLLIEIAWNESKIVKPKLKKYSSLSTDSAHILIHEIGHALGLEHSGCGEKVCSKNLDPNDSRFNNRVTVMSYNNFLFPTEESFFTTIDIKALRTLWGFEKEN